ncbi:hypothetical protein HY495_00525 [Candidatus Woesearchaeota archaeon]|nr:hypothetical protein [Candidatus Woesearchaeota archaeon]
MFGDFVFTKRIDLTTVNILFNFKRYSTRDFRSDYTLTKNIYYKEWFKDQNVPTEIREDVKLAQFYELVFKREIYQKIRAGEKLKISYHQFKKISAKLLAEFIFYVLRQSEFKRVIEGRDKIIVNVSVMEGTEEGTYAEMIEGDSDFQRISLDVSGAWLLGRICLPWMFLKKIDSAFLLKTISHELQHYLELTRGIYQKEYTAIQKISKFMRVNPKKIGALPVVYEILCNLYTEGIAVFQEKRYARYIKFDLNKIELIRREIEVISVMKDKRRAQERYERVFPDSESGEYYLGFMMCFCIGLSLAQKENAILSILAPRKETIPYAELNSYILQNRNFVAAQLSPNIFVKTYTKLSAITTFQKFVNEYLHSCRELGLEQPVQFIDKKWITKIIRNTKRAGK